MSLAGLWWRGSILPTQETPAGIVDGVNRTFTLAFIPVPNSVALFVGGLRQTPGVNYTLVEVTGVITTATPPALGTSIHADYLH
jgi:hypothetical protein